MTTPHSTLSQSGAILKMAPWIASRSYALGSGEARSAVANERRHEFLVLENESAELWSRIEKGIGHDDLLALATNLEVAESLPAFLEELAEADLLADLTGSQDDVEITQFTPPPRNPSNTQLTPIPNTR